MKLISLQAAIDAMYSLCDPTLEEYKENPHIDAIVETLENLSEPWIPCSERLPEEYDDYLITYTTSQSKRPFIAICEGEETREYDHERNRFKFEWLLEDYIKAYPNVEVIAWMPLPEPYTEME